MQDTLANPPQWLQLALTVVASILGGVGIDRLYNSWLNRKKPTAEIHLTEASATEVTVRANSTASDAVIRMLARLDSAQETIDRVRAERDAWEEQYGEVFTEKIRLQRENSKLLSEVDTYEKQIKRMQRTLADNDLNFDNTQNTPVQPTDC
jgi:chromosome segregation ATPase